VQHPDVINDQPRLIADAFVVPHEALDLVPDPLCHAARLIQETSIPEETAMTFEQWLRKTFRPTVQGSRTSLRRKFPQSSPHRSVPWLELLEDRLTPALLTVTKQNDSGAGS
jgi:hypothetical protein